MYAKIFNVNVEEYIFYVHEWKCKKTKKQINKITITSTLTHNKHRGSQNKHLQAGTTQILPVGPIIIHLLLIIYLFPLAGLESCFFQGIVRTALLSSLFFLSTITNIPSLMLFCLIYLPLHLFILFVLFHFYLLPYLPPLCATSFSFGPSFTSQAYSFSSSFLHHSLNIIFPSYIFLILLLNLLHFVCLYLVFISSSPCFLLSLFFLSLFFLSLYFSLPIFSMFSFYIVSVYALSFTFSLHDAETRFQFIQSHNTEEIH